MRISVYADKAGVLRTLLAGMKRLDRDIAKHMRRETKNMVQQEWQRAVAEHADTRLEQLVLASTARVAVSDRNVKLKSAHLSKRLSGGLTPSAHYGPVEFGAAIGQSSVTQRSRRGRTYSYKRTTGRQFKRPNKSGYVVYPAAKNIIPRLASLWVQTMVRAFHEAAEGR